MSKQLQLRRGTTIQNEAFTGAVGELTLDTDTGEIRVHDGVTQGGAEFIDAVVAFQKPTAENNYTWFRKYASGWVEMGGTLENISNGYVINFPVTMANTKYTAGLFPFASGNFNLGYNTPTTSSMTVYTSYNGAWFSWRVEGLAA